MLQSKPRQDESISVPTQLRWAATLAWCTTTVAGCVFFGWLSLLLFSPLILGPALSGRWRRLGRGLTWFGAIFASFWVLPYAVALLLPMRWPRPPNPLVIAVSVPVVVFVVWLDVALVADYTNLVRNRHAVT